MVHVLAQVRFPRVFGISERIGDVAGRMRDIGFPRFAESQIQNVLLDGTNAVKIDTIGRWDFLDRDKGSGVVLTQDFVLLHTACYTVFEEFDAVMAEVLEVTTGVLDAPLVERVGLRYVDLVQPAADERVTEYLKPGLIGYPLDEVPLLESASSLSRVETVVRTDAGHLSIRCFQRNDGAFLPPDLWPTILESRVHVRPGEVVTILDLDHATIEPIDFTLEEIRSTLHDLHDAIDIAFRGAVTSHALAAWGEEPLT